MGVECRQVGSGSASWHLYGSTARGHDDVELPAIGKDERHLVCERVHRIPQISVLLCLCAAADRSPRVTNVNKRSRATVLLINGTLFARSTKLSGFCGVISPMPLRVMTTA